MHEEALAGREPSALDDVRIDREEGLRQAAGIDERDRLRTRQTMGRLGHRILRIAAADHQGADLIAERQTRDVAPDRDHTTGDFEAGNLGGAGRRRIDPARCATSGRFTPAATTSIRTCPGPACGTGAVSTLITSGPPEPAKRI